jgi:hypothetical protein
VYKYMVFPAEKKKKEEKEMQVPVAPIWYP